MELSPEEIARAMRVVDQIKAQSKGIRRLSRKLEECSRNYAKACFELDLSRNETARVQQTLRQLLADISTLREQVRAAGAEPRV
jgi:septal ring factor EnvC (AmiA/AmiB activator)